MILITYPDEPASSRQFYSGQKPLQTFLILIAVICIPWLLLGKPIYRIMMNKRRAHVSICQSFPFDSKSISLNDENQVFISNKSTVN